MLKIILYYDAAEMDDKTAAYISKVCENPEFSVAHVRKVSAAASGLAAWVHSLNEFVKVRPRFLELREK